MDDMQYLYHEEQNPEDFFLPYLWNIVISNTGNVPWDEKQIKLFTIIPPSSSSSTAISLLSSASNVVP
jgi:hypothetical protein